MSLKPRSRRSGYALIAVGIAFFIMAITGDRAAFYGIGAVFLVLGAVALRKPKDAI